MKGLKDSQPLFSNSHKNTITPWYKRWASRLKYWFIRPKLSESSLETVYIDLKKIDDHSL